MKLKELKHNHSLTDLLKILIFSLLMLAPILSVATRCLYVVCNKNAYQSYYGETINEKEIKVLHNTNDIINHEVYYRNAIATTTGETENYKLYFDNVEIIENTNTGITNQNILDTKWLSVITYGTNSLTEFYDISNTQIGQVNSNQGQLLLQFTVINETHVNSTITRNQNIFVWEYNKYSYLDNVFEYSVHALEDNQLFNWTKNTAVYTGVNAMTTNLEIEGSVIPILITYWFLLTIIYVIIDIVLKLFTILTHMIGNKTA